MGNEMKYRLAIADDEKLIRESLAQFISWEELGFELILVAEDGEQVIEVLKQKRLDVVLCDIQMQDKSGLDVAEFAWKNKLDCLIVLLSGYAEFEYAQKAIRYNVKEYLLKPINLGKIKETFQRIHEELDKREEEKKHREEFREKEETFLHMAVTQMCEKAMMGMLKEPEECRLFLQKFGVSEDVLKEKTFLLHMVTSQMEEYEVLEHEILHNILELLAKPNQIEDIIIISEKELEKRAETEFEIVLLCKESFTSELAANYLQEIKRAIQDICNIQAEVYYEKEGINLKELIHYLCEQFVFPSEVLTDVGGKEMYLNTIAKQYLLILNMCTDVNEVKDNLKYLYEQHCQEMQERKFLSEIINHMQEFLQREHPDKKVSKINEENEEKYFFSAMEGFYHYLHETESNHLSLIKRVKKNVREHVNDNISLSMAAEQVFLSPSYFSRIFKEQTGENFSEYCIRVKMEKAAEMMRNPEKRIYEISEELGYKNIKYFYKLFKRTYHCTPSEYKEKIRLEYLSDTKGEEM